MMHQKFLSTFPLKGQEKNQGRAYNLEKRPNECAVTNRLQNNQATFSPTLPLITVHIKKLLDGRIIQFSYMTGNKRERQYPSGFVDMTKPSFTTIGVFANWFRETNKEG